MKRDHIMAEQDRLRDAIVFEALVRPIFDPQPEDVSGIYLQVGTGGMRVGQAKNLSRRIRQSNRRYRDCLGSDIAVFRVRMPDSTEEQRRAFEQMVIDTFNTTRSCNLRRS